MHTAATAVIDLPPPTPAAQRRTAASTEEFDARVEAALQEDRAAEPEAPEQADASEQQPSPTPTAETQPQPALQTNAAPIVLQMISVSEATPVIGDASTTQGGVAPHTEPAPQPAAVNAETANASVAKSHDAKPTTDRAFHANAETAPQPQLDATPQTPTTAAQPQAQALPVQHSAQPAAQPTGQQQDGAALVTPVAPLTQSAKAQQPSTAKSRTLEGEPLGAEGKSDKAALKQAQAQGQPQADPKVASTPGVLRDAPAPTALAPDAHPHTLLQSGALSAAPVQTPQQAALDASVAARAAPAGAQVAREIIRRFDGGAARFELRLDPPELGRVEVRLDVTRDHRVTAVVAAESPQALAELMRHARDLEQTLQSAGLQLSENGLSFDLRERERGFEDRLNETRVPGDSADDTATTSSALTARPIGYERWRGARVDLMV
ncbi:MAG: flagellar hook-length control protein FliK [Hyphomonadaceae bacterium]|nr:flagellar hook-length control protein FliK [Hyphomonadaceae bacterium]